VKTEQTGLTGAAAHFTLGRPMPRTPDATKISIAFAFVARIRPR
jgi:hypothetical protein